jgi:SAM-dependent methyltransferase
VEVTRVARTADFDLAKELARPSFTPGARDATALVELIVAGDEPAATRAAPALAQLGAVGRAAVEARLAAADATGPEPGAAAPAAATGARPAGPPPGPSGRGKTKPRKHHAAPAAPGAAGTDEGARARLVGVLGLLARGGDAEARAQVIARSGDPAARVRKAAAIALGKLGGDDARAALIARWDAGDAPPEERRALAEALGKVGGDDALARLRGLAPSADGELMRRRDRAVLMADRTARRDEDSRIIGDVAPPAPITVQLGCRPGLGSLLLEELAALGIAAQPLGDRGAELRLARPFAALFAARLWATAAIPIPLAAAADLATAIVQTITAPATLALLRGWTRGPIRWRLGFERGHKRAIVWRVARDVTAAVPALINDPTATTWDFLVDDEARTLALVPRRLDDPRFAYRVADIPAASHPTVAAALAWLAEPRAGDRVWDPFCGSGLELIERARRGPTRALIGSDLEASAIEAAHRNLAAAGVAAELACADARSHTPGSVDLILTNPPLGSRVQLDAAALLVAALPNFVRALAPGGRLVWLTPSPRKTSPVAEQLGLRRTRSLPVDLGGVRGQVERWDRP